jgi:hypothetical protein
MSRRPIDRSPELKKLRDEGLDIEASMPTYSDRECSRQMIHCSSTTISSLSRWASHPSFTLSIGYERSKPSPLIIKRRFC